MKEINGLSILFYTAWFRPTLGRDVAVELLNGLELRGHRIAAVIGTGESFGYDTSLEVACSAHGWTYIEAHPAFKLSMKTWSTLLKEDSSHRESFQAWIDTLSKYKADIGLLYFSTWIPSVMTALCPMGFVNFHPGPLPHIRGFLPEDWALLSGYRSFGGTVHKVETDIDTGPILALTEPAPIQEWDTPDSFMQSIAEYGLPGILDAIDSLYNGDAKWTIQNPNTGFDASYEAVYPYSFINWVGDTHEMLHRKFQVFRGQAHRIVLKAQINNTIIEILSWELHRGCIDGVPGQILYSNGKILVIQSSEGICIITESRPYLKEPGSLQYKDVKRMDSIEVIPSGYRPPVFSRTALQRIVPEFSPTY